MVKTLELQFVTESGASSNLSIDSPNEPLDPAAIQAVMENIIAQDAFVTPTGALVGIKGARLIEREVTPVDFA